MANIASQIKRNRQNERERARNKAKHTALKTELKKFRTAVDAGDADAAAEQLRTAKRSLDKAASSGIVHANYAANKKSNMAKQLAKL